MGKAICVSLDIKSFSSSSYLDVSELTYSSAMSKPYVITTKAFYLKREIIKPEDIIGSTCTVTIKTEYNETCFCGIVTYLYNIIESSLNSVNYTHKIELKIESIFSLLKKNRNSRVFPKGKVTDIIQKVVKDYDIELKLPSGNDFIDREFAIQFNETDYDFIHRLMEEEGIFYYHTFSKDKATLVLCSSTGDYSKNETLTFGTGSNYYQYSSFYEQSCIQQGKATFNDYDHTVPEKDILAQDIKNKSKLTNIESPADYIYPMNIKSYDKPDDKTSELGTKSAELYLEAVQAQNETVTIHPSPVIWWGLDTGSKIKADWNKNEYVVTSFSFHLVMNDESQNKSTVTAINADIACRPLALTPIPNVPIQTAKIIGTDSSSELFFKTDDDCDKNIYVKVKFPWDIINKDNSETCSCWIRSGQPWAGNGKGFIFVPRLNDEVIIAFEHGHPDRPIIICSVNNGANLLPYSLKKNQATSAIVGKSTPKGSGASSAIVFVDDKDKEQFALLTVGSCYSRVKKERFIESNDSILEYVKKDVNVTVDGNLLHKVKGEVSADIGSDINIKSGGKVNIEAKEISFKVGGNFIKIDSSGVTINGSQTKINSGGSGNAASVTEPQKLPDDLSKVDSYKMIKE